ncbi:hypothetical protein ACIA49_09680 [Kribbella sp. NPDC051587]|uniref:hypothetical protein n=1 Tax=Kribbella sp. NPDC051587 TaxID=3364119 RepID=UPI00379DCA89
MRGAVKFWSIETAAEAATVRVMLQRRFPQAYALLAQSLEEADPCEVVYPDNPDEYDDVVREMLVMSDRVGGDFSRLSRPEVETMVREGLDRCFGTEPYDEPDEAPDEPDEARLQKAVDLIVKYAGAAERRT